MPERGLFGQSRLCWGRGFGPAGEMGFHQAPPEWREERDGAGQRQGPWQAGGILGQAEGRVGAGGVAVVVGMARGVQEQGRGKPMRGVPGMASVDRFDAAIRACGPCQAVMLDVV